MGVREKFTKYVTSAMLAAALAMPAVNGYAVGTSTSEKVPDNRIEQAYEKLQPRSITDLVVLPDGYVTSEFNEALLEHIHMPEERDEYSSPKEFYNSIDSNGNHIISNEEMEKYSNNRNLEERKERLEDRISEAREHFSSDAKLIVLPGGDVTSAELGKYILQRAGLEAGYLEANESDGLEKTAKYARDKFVYRNRDGLLPPLKRAVRSICEETANDKGIITTQGLDEYLKPETAYK